MARDLAQLTSEALMLGGSSGVNLPSNLGDSYSPAMMQAYAINQELVDNLKKAGICFVRMACEWDIVERTNGVYNFLEIKNAVEMLAKNGIDTYLKIFATNVTNAGFTPILGVQGATANCQDVITDANLGASSRFRAYVRNAYLALGHVVKDWGFLNEPDLGDNFRGFEFNLDGTTSTTGLTQTTTKGLYLTQLYKAVREEMLKVNRSTGFGLRLWGANLTSWSNPMWDVMCRNGFLDLIDGIDNHYYTRSDSAKAYNPEVLLRQQKLMVDTARLYSNGRTIPILVGEFGNANRDNLAGTDKFTGTEWDIRQGVLIHPFLTKLFPDFPIAKHCFFDGVGVHPTLFNKSYSDGTKSALDTGYTWFDMINDASQEPAKQQFLPTYKHASYIRYVKPWEGLELDRVIVKSQFGDLLFDTGNILADTVAGYDVGTLGNVQTFTFSSRNASTMVVTGDLVLNIGDTDYTIALVAGDTVAQVIAKMRVVLGNVARVVLVSSKIVIYPLRTTVTTVTATSATGFLLDNLGAYTITTATRNARYQVGSLQWLYDALDSINYTEPQFASGIGSTGTGAKTSAFAKQQAEPIYSSIWYVFCKDTKRGNKLTVLPYRFHRYLYFSMTIGTLRDFGSVPIADRNQYAFKRAIMSQGELQGYYPLRTFVTGFDVKATRIPTRLNVEL